MRWTWQNWRRPHLAVLFIFAILTLIITYPLVTHLFSHVPGSPTWAFDEFTYLWNQWWFKHSVLDVQSNPFHSDLIYYPLGIDLVLYTYHLFHAVVGLPLQLVFGVPFASNLMLWFSTITGGYGAFLLVRWLLRGSRATTPWLAYLPALGAGLLYAFSANRAIYQALGHYSIANVQWLPFALLYFLKALGESGARGRRAAALAGLFAAFFFLTEMTFGIFLALALLILLPFEFINRRAAARAHGAAQPDWRDTLVKLGVAGLVALVVSSYLLFPVVRELTQGGYELEGWGDALKLSSDLVGLATPVALHPLWGQDWVQTLRDVKVGQAQFLDVNTNFLGWLTLALALLGAVVAWKRARGWVWLVLVFTLLALGPLLQINGQYRFDLDGLLPEGVTVPLPYALTHFLPVLNANRSVNRFGLVVMLALAVLVGYALDWLLRRPLFSRRPRLALVVTALLLGGLLFEHLAWPMPLSDARTPAFYQQIAQEPGQFAIMHLPLGWRNSFRVFGAEDTRLQWYQQTHQRPMLGGNISRSPAIKLGYFERLPLFQALTGIEMYQPPSPAVDAAARAQAAALMTLYNVRYLVVTPPIPGRYPYVDTWQATRDYALDVLPLDPTPVVEADGYQVYRVQAPAPTLPFVLDFGTQDTQPYRGDHWSADEADLAGASAAWITGTETDLYFPLRPEPGQAYRATLRMTPYSFPGAPTQTVQASLNGVPVGQATLTPGWNDYTFDLPAAVVTTGPNTLHLALANTHQPRQVQPETALIGQTGVPAPAVMDVHAFDEAFMTITDDAGRTVDASAGRRGINVAVVDEQTGQLLDRRGFDTAANSYEATALADFLATVPTGRIVLVATKGDGTAFVTPAARTALANLGIRPDFSAGDRLAAVGVQGAAPGAAAQAVGSDDAYLRVGGDARHLAAAVDRVVITRADGP